MLDKRDRLFSKSEKSFDRTSVVLYIEIYGYQIDTPHNSLGCIWILNI